ncbi:hypothetical protein [Nocardioides marmorisolisilvae]|uniref:Lipoprotein n=1 Tax=Nocardioides marmorisolisilvae TaxID=1542737 RepID=A0A3N0DV44_9ACTN|nr:hypothetical protein [Nocardioides marmorisolisilvae]RNL79494.1 hypothetical protein EFL95_10955 [Nocardioides marmorisolisilvae]
MARTGARILALTAAAVLAVTVTGCGSKDSSDGKKASGPSTPATSTTPATPTVPATPDFAKQPPGIIVKDAIDAMSKVHKIRLTGTFIDDGKHLDLDVRTDGAGNCAGKLTQDGATTQFVATKRATYLKGDREFWKQSVGKDAATTISYLHGRWAKVEASKEFANLCNVGTLIAQAGGKVSGDPADSDGTVSAVQTYHGQDVIEVSDSQGSETYSFLVEVAEPHRVLRLDSETKNDPGSLRFVYDNIPAVVVPAAQDSVAFGG